MPDARCSVSYHFRLDPSKQIVGLLDLPQEIVRTIAVGDQVANAKVPLDSIPLDAREQLEVQLAEAVVAATRTAKPLAAPVPPTATPAPSGTAAAAPAEEGLSLF